MAVHQAPTGPTATATTTTGSSPTARGTTGSSPTAGGGHLHVEFYPPRRTATKLKYLAGSEQGAGTFISDTLPERSAQKLRRAIADGA
jgi:hypothetical protein